MAIKHVSEAGGYRAPDDSQRVIQFLVDPETTALRSMKLGITTIEPGRSTHVAVHEREEIYLVLQGAGWVMLGSEKADVSPGSVVAIAPNEPHQIGASHEQLVYSWVSADPPLEVAERRDWPAVAAPRGPFTQPD